jgi:DNA-directed RNA polymerase specialized sigma24 family protein
MNGPAHRSDEELVHALAAGDDLALAMLAGRHARGVYDFALRATLDPTVSAGVTQATFHRAADGASEPPAQIGFRTWLYSLALVEVLAVANDRSTSRLSLGDPRFTETDPPQEHEIALWAWQAARSLRTRDYCVLDLTLRRELAPEELADAASLTRNNLYASIGRARGAFEDSFAATALYLRGRDACPELARLTSSVGGGGVRPALRHQIAEHAETCDACRETLASLPSASDIFAALVDVEMPADLPARVLVGDNVDANAPQLSLEAPPEAPAPAPEEPAAVPAQAGEEEPQPMAVFSPPARASWSRPAGATLTTTNEAAASTANEAPAGATVTTQAQPAAAAGPAVTRRYVSDETLAERVRSWFDFGAQPIHWTYALLGVITVLAIYLGIAVGDSLQGGGGDAGAVPFIATPGAGGVIDCGSPIMLTQGTSTVVSFDAKALGGYTIAGGTVVPTSAQAKPDGLQAISEDATSIRFTATRVDSTTARIDDYDLLVNWQHGSDAATSTCKVQVKVGP